MRIQLPDLHANLPTNHLTVHGTPRNAHPPGSHSTRVQRLRRAGDHVASPSLRRLTILHPIPYHSLQLRPRPTDGVGQHRSPAGAKVRAWWK